MATATEEVRGEKIEGNDGIRIGQVYALALAAVKKAGLSSVEIVGLIPGLEPMTKPLCGGNEDESLEDKAVEVGSVALAIIGWLKIADKRKTELRVVVP